MSIMDLDSSGHLHGAISRADHQSDHKGAGSFGRGSVGATSVVRSGDRPKARNDDWSCEAGAATTCDNQLSLYHSEWATKRCKWSLW
jgi:hypothetical protein